MADFANELAESHCYSMLMDHRCVAKAHEHDQPLIQSKWCQDCCQWYVIGVHLGLEETVHHIDCCPDLSFGIVIQYIVNSW